MAAKAELSEDQKILKKEGFTRTFLKKNLKENVKEGRKPQVWLEFMHVEYGLTRELLKEIIASWKK